MNQVNLISILIFNLLWIANLNANSPESESKPEPRIVQDGLRIIESYKATDDIHIDGRFDEEDWENTVFQLNFIQRDPHLGEPASEETQVAILQNRSHTS